MVAEPVAGKRQRPDDFARAPPAKVKKLTESSTEPLASKCICFVSNLVYVYSAWVGCTINANDSWCIIV